ncbi:MAG: glycine cleavage system protein H [Candidatus Thorarchaeota archaeon]
MEVEGYLFPNELYYHPDHTWARIVDDRAQLGITSYAGHLAGEIKAITPRPPKKDVMQGGAMATLESNKWVGPLRSPLTGTIVVSNSALLEDFSSLVNDPYGDGWICIIEHSDLEEDLKMLFHGEEAVKEWMLMEIHGKK